MRLRGIWLIGIVTAVAALLLAVGLLLPEQKTPNSAKATVVDKRSTRQDPATSNPQFHGSQKTVKDFKTPFTMKRLSDEHDRQPTEEEWRELIWAFREICDEKEGIVRVVLRPIPRHGACGQRRALLSECRLRSASRH